MNEVTVNGITYRLLKNTCGGSNKNCKKCARGGEGHGPYWFAFKMGYSRKYIGKNLPEAIQNHLDLLKSQKDRLQEIKKLISLRSEQHRKEHVRAENELRAVDALLRGQYVDQQTLKDLSLDEFCLNGHK